MVLDGHGDHGDRISEFTMRQIAISLEKHPALEMDPVTALKETFVNTNTALLVTPMNFMTSGTTCVAAYYANNTLFVANCGDSRAVVAVAGADGTLTAQELSRDHKPDDPIEQARIEASGGFVSPPPRPGLSARVYLDQAHTMIGLAMARSIGDYAVKGVGVTAEPEVKTYPVDESYQFLIMASDGVWEFMSSQVRGVLRCGVLWCALTSECAWMHASSLPRRHNLNLVGPSLLLPTHPSSCFAGGGGCGASDAVDGGRGRRGQGLRRRVPGVDRGGRQEVAQRGG